MSTDPAADRIRTATDDRLRELSRRRLTRYSRRLLEEEARRRGVQITPVDAEGFPVGITP